MTVYISKIELERSDRRSSDGKLEFTPGISPARERDWPLRVS